MKKWFKPQVSELGIVDTLDPKVHLGYCHKPNVNGTCMGMINDHSADGHKGHMWTGNTCDEHGDGNNGQPACCCGPGVS